MISLLQFDNFAIAPDGIQFGEAESREFTKQGETNLQKFRAYRPNIGITITGVTDSDVVFYQSAVEAGSDFREIISYGGRGLTGCRLISAEVSNILQVGDIQLVDTLRLLYESNTWTHGVAFERFKGFVVDLDGIQFGDGDSISVQYADSGVVRTAIVKRRKVGITLKGTSPSDYQTFLSLLNSDLLNPLTEDITLGGITLNDAVLTSVTPTASITTGLGEISDSLVLEYETRNYDVPFSQGTFDGFPIANINVSADTKIFVINQSGSGRRDVPTFKRKISFSVIGTPAEYAVGYISKVENVADALNPEIISLTVAGYTIASAILVNVTPSETVAVGGREIRASTQLEFISRYWSYDLTGEGEANFFDGYEVDSFSLNDVDGQQVLLNRNGVQSQVAIARQSATIGLAGVKVSDVVLWRSAAAASRRNLVNGSSPDLRSVGLLGVALDSCYLISAVPSGKEYLVGTEKLVDSITLIYETLEWNY
jgi:hypothetical protein